MKAKTGIGPCRGTVYFIWEQGAGMTIKDQSLQTDMLKQISTMLKVTACLDDEHVRQINNIVFQLDDLVGEMEVCVGEELSLQDTPKKPSLTII